MKALIIATLIAVGIGFLLGVLRYVLDDKWNVLPKSMCRFCASFWGSFILNVVPCMYFVVNEYSLLPIAVSYVLSVSVATGLSALSYVYIKNAN